MAALNGRKSRLVFSFFAELVLWPNFSANIPRLTISNLKKEELEFLAIALLPVHTTLCLYKRQLDIERLGPFGLRTLTRMDPQKFQLEHFRSLFFSFLEFSHLYIASIFLCCRISSWRHIAAASTFFFLSRVRTSGVFAFSYFEIGVNAFFWYRHSCQLFVSPIHVLLKCTCLNLLNAHENKNRNNDEIKLSLTRSSVSFKE